MPIPREVLDVERPVNTIVIAYGKKKDRYAVRQRVGCKRVNGRNIPVNGPTIGHIVDLKYVPLQKDPPETADSPVVLKSWADILLCDRLFRPVREELREVYNAADSAKFTCMAILGVCTPGLREEELEDAYQESFLSELYPDVDLAQNTVSKFLHDLGRTCSRIMQFMRNRAEQIPAEHHLLIGSTFQSGESDANRFPRFSRNVRTQGKGDRGLLYAFDLEAMEPVCTKGFFGTAPDAADYTSFLEETGIPGGILAEDRIVPRKADASGKRPRCPNLHCLKPIVRDARRREQYQLLDSTAT